MTTSLNPRPTPQLPLLHRRLPRQCAAEPGDREPVVLADALDELMAALRTGTATPPAETE